MKNKFIILGLTCAAVFSTCAFLALGAKSFIPAVGEEEYRTIVLDKDNNCCKGLQENEEFVLTNNLGVQGGTFSYECGTLSENIEFGYSNHYFIYASNNKESDADFGMRFTFNIKGLRSYEIDPYGLAGYHIDAYDDKGELYKSSDHGDESYGFQSMAGNMLSKVVFTIYASPESTGLFIVNFKLSYFVSECLALCE